MAQTIYCDAEGCNEPADMMLNRIGTGDVQAYCDGHFAELVFAMATQMAEADQADNQVTEDNLPDHETPADDNGQEQTGKDNLDHEARNEPPGE